MQTLVQSIQIDFDNGQGYVPVPFDTPLSVHYTTVGTKIWKYKLTQSNGTTFYSHSIIRIEEGLNILPYDNSSSNIAPTDPPTDQNCPLSSYPIFAYSDSGQLLAANLIIHDGQCDGIKRPFIIAEGFDTGNANEPENVGGKDPTAIFEVQLRCQAVYNCKIPFIILQKDMI